MQADKTPDDAYQFEFRDELVSNFREDDLIPALDEQETIEVFVTDSKAKNNILIEVYV